MSLSAQGSQGWRPGGRTRVAGVFGDPIHHTLSPLMHNQAFHHLGLDWVYVPFRVPASALATAVRAVGALDLGGVNVTVPHKVAVIQHLDEISPVARRLGAVNTIVPTRQGLRGENTDGEGFLRSLTQEAGVDPKGLKIVILGAGGAARAIAVTLGMAGAAELLIANRTGQRAVALAAGLEPGPQVRGISLADPALAEAVQAADVVVHTTSTGMYPHIDDGPVIDPDWLQPRTLVCDIVYNPRETTLLAAARSRGCPVLPGLGMLAYQGAVAFEMWTGREAPVDVMQRVLQAALAGAAAEDAGPDAARGPS